MSASQASLLLAGLSLVAVLVIGFFTVRSGTKSAEASVKAAKATEESATASKEAAKATADSATASKEAAKATERSVTASERAAALAAQDARARRLEAALDVVLEMREMFNDQNERLGDKGYPAFWEVDVRSVEGLRRGALRRKLDARLAALEADLGSLPAAHSLTTKGVDLWASGLLEDAIAELKGLLKATVQAG